MTARDDISTHDPPPPDPRPRYRVPLGMPLRDEGRRAGAVVSVLVHAIVIGLLVIPFLLPTAVIARMQQGAGGAGPAGGGGGGRRGTGGTIETLRFVRIAPNPAPAATNKPAVAAPLIPKIAPPPPKPVPVVPPAEAKPATPAPSTTVAAATPGANGGSGRDGTSGAGPGSGGGVGSGVGPGRGSANGPGTGGGNQTNYPPTPTEFFLPPLPQPDNVRGIKFIAEFDVDSTGRVLDIKFTETPNGDYNRKLYAVLRSMHFRPGTRPDGTPIRMKAQVGYEF
jgi:protein TonB